MITMPHLPLPLTSLALCLLLISGGPVAGAEFPDAPSNTDLTPGAEVDAVGANLASSEIVRASMERAAEAAKAQSEQNDRLFRSYLSLQEQLHDAVQAIDQDRKESSTALQERIQEAVAAIEKNRRETSTALQVNTKEFTDQLLTFQAKMASAREDHLKAMQSSNQLILIIAAAFAGVGLLALVLASWLQLRAMNRITEITTHYALPPHQPYQLQHAEQHPLDLPISNGLGNAIERLESRVRELEHSPQIDPESQSKNKSEPNGVISEETSAKGDINETHSTPEVATKGAANTALALQIAKGQALLNLNKPADALRCFDIILESHPGHTDTWVKKGTALERLRKLDDALECYDRAILSDGSSTLAYLYKGGVYNQLERFNDALACYEKALHSQEESDHTPTANGS